MVDKIFPLCYNIGVKRMEVVDMKMTLKAIKENKGATLDNHGRAVTYKTGFQVSRKDLFVCRVNKLRMRDIEEILADMPSTSNLGIWIDGGLAYVDISERIANRAHALKVGSERKQISVWAWKKSEAVAC